MGYVGHNHFFCCGATNPWIPHYFCILILDNDDVSYGKNRFKAYDARPCFSTCRSFHGYN